jgi:hypothetical protein
MRTNISRKSGAVRMTKYYNTADLFISHVQNVSKRPQIRSNYITLKVRQKKENRAGKSQRRCGVIRRKEISQNAANYGGGHTYR